MASPNHGHQSPLEGVIDFSLTHLLNAEQHNMATDIFNQIIVEYEPSQMNGKGYKQITLLRVMNDSITHTDNFLNFFFVFLEKELRQQSETDLSEISLSQALSRFINLHSWTTEERSALNKSLATFADYLVDNFFLPLKASSVKTPQPTPAPLSGARLSEQVIGTPQRISNLRRDCLIRDRHRCIISHRFDTQEAQHRSKRDGRNVKDDDGQLLLPESETLAFLEVAHIIPHSLMSFTNIGGNLQLSDSKRIAIQILNMFDPGAVHLIDGPNIDRPMNALSLTHDLHRLFGGFEIYFEPVTTQPHTYKIDYVQPDRIFRTEKLPVTVTLYLTPDRNIDPPSPRLLAIHRAIGRILHLSAAGDYIDEILRDMEELEIKENGSTPLGHYIHLKLGAWIDGVSAY